MKNPNWKEFEILTATQEQLKHEEISGIIPEEDLLSSRITINLNEVYSFFDSTDFTTAGASESTKLKFLNGDQVDIMYPYDDFKNIMTLSE